MKFNSVLWPLGGSTLSYYGTLQNTMIIAPGPRLQVLGPAAPVDQQHHCLL